MSESILDKSKTPLSEGAIKQLFTEARTYPGWLPQGVDDEILHAIYDLMKWGPTSANLTPARIVFVKSPEQKEKLISCLMPQNIEKVKAAPVTAIVAHDDEYYELIPKLFPHGAAFLEIFRSNKEFRETGAIRNSSLQGAYLIIAARALGLDCGPMSGFDNKKVDEMFFAGMKWKSNFICNLGHGDKASLHPRLPRLSFEEACRIV
jgi:3-hydroxypropanoate dehydrogenase